MVVISRTDIASAKGSPKASASPSKNNANARISWKEIKSGKRSGSFSPEPDISPGPPPREPGDWLTSEAKQLWCGTCSPVVSITDDHVCALCLRNRLRATRWTSGNALVDDFIRSTQETISSTTELIQWIDYTAFSNVNFVAKGGFGAVHSASWMDGYVCGWDPRQLDFKRRAKIKVAIKTMGGGSSGLPDAEGFSEDFLNELKLHHEVGKRQEWDIGVVRLYGVSRHPETGHFMMVMKYCHSGDLRHWFREVINGHNRTRGVRVPFRDIYGRIARVLAQIHAAGLCHRDLHAGNILMTGFAPHIGDLGLCTPIDPEAQLGPKKIFGVLPYIAPEVLRGGQFTPAADIYSLGMVMWETVTGRPPFWNMAHGVMLEIDICEGLRPPIPKGTPTWFAELITLCWEADPLGRPTAANIRDLMAEMCDIMSWQARHIKPDKDAATIIDTSITTTTTSSLEPATILDKTPLPMDWVHPEAVYTSRITSTKSSLPYPKNASYGQYFASVEMSRNWTTLECSFIIP